MDKAEGREAFTFLLENPEKVMREKTAATAMIMI